MIHQSVFSNLFKCLVLGGFATFGAISCKVEERPSTSSPGVLYMSPIMCNATAQTLSLEIVNLTGQPLVDPAAGEPDTEGSVFCSDANALSFWFAPTVSLFPQGSSTVSLTCDPTEVAPCPAGLYTCVFVGLGQQTDRVYSASTTIDCL